MDIFLFIMLICGAIQFTSILALEHRHEDNTKEAKEEECEDNVTNLRDSEILHNSTNSEELDEQTLPPFEDREEPPYDTDAPYVDEDELWPSRNMREACGHRVAPAHLNKCVKNVQQRLKGGATVRRNREWPWTVFIDVYYTRCAGSLITVRHVLSAAHCFYVAKSIRRIALKFIKLYIGVTKIPSEKVYEPERIIIHEMYYFLNLYHDIAVVLLKTAVDESHSKMRICLPTPKHLRTHSFNKKTAWFAGWGMERMLGNHTDQMKAVKLRVFSQTFCQEYYVFRQRRITLQSHQMCVGYEGFSPCKGDAGGPLMYEDHNQQWYLIGIGSYNDDCDNDPAILTRVTSHLKWIKHNVDFNLT